MSVASWYPHRLDDNVLWLHYEDMQDNIRECVRLIADFLEIGSGDKTLQELIINQVCLWNHWLTVDDAFVAVVQHPFYEETCLEI